MYGNNDTCSIYATIHMISVFHSLSPKNEPGNEANNNNYAQMLVLFMQQKKITLTTSNVITHTHYEQNS